MKLLHIDSSMLGEASASRQITRSVVERLRWEYPGLEVTYRDLASDPLPHLTGQEMAAGQKPHDALDEALHARVRTNAAVLDEFMNADIVVVGAPMYNFAIPSVLKAWIDRISIAGKTFRYTKDGPEGLAGDKRIVIASSRGGLYAEGSAYAAMDFQETYLRAVFGFLGISDVEVVRAEGLNLGPAQRQAALDAAVGLPDRLAA